MNIAQGAPMTEPFQPFQPPPPKIPTNCAEINHDPIENAGGITQIVKSFEADVQVQADALARLLAPAFAQPQPSVDELIRQPQPPHDDGARFNIQPRPPARPPAHRARRASVPNFVADDDINRARLMNFMDAVVYSEPFQAVRPQQPHQVIPGPPSAPIPQTAREVRPNQPMVPPGKPGCHTSRGRRKSFSSPDRHPRPDDPFAQARIHIQGRNMESLEQVIFIIPSSPSILPTPPPTLTLPDPCPLSPCPLSPCPPSPCPHPHHPHPIRFS